MSFEQVRIRQKKRIRSFALDRDELRKLLDLLQERSYAAYEIEKKHLTRSPECTDEQFQQMQKELEEGFELFITLSGTDGRELTGNISEIFDSPNFPDEVASLFFDTSTHLRVRHKYFPRNKMILFLDFKRPEIFNFSVLPSQETKNESNIEIEGTDATWVNGVFQEFFNFVNQRPSTLPWLHRHTVYDIMLWLIGFPLSFWICSKSSIHIEAIFSQKSAFLRSALYFYLFIIALNLLRVSFHYARWIWPLTEFKSPKSKSIKHKALFSLIISGLGLPALYDFLKWLW